MSIAPTETKNKLKLYLIILYNTGKSNESNPASSTPVVYDCVTSEHIPTILHTLRVKRCCADKIDEHCDEESAKSTKCAKHANGLCLYRMFEPEYVQTYAVNVSLMNQIAYNRCAVIGKGTHCIAAHLNNLVIE